MQRCLFLVLLFTLSTHAADKSAILPTLPTIAVEDKCPKDVTESEKDGLFSSKSKIRKSSQERAEAFKKCQPPADIERVSAGELKKSPCACHMGNSQEGYEALYFTSSLWSKHTRHQECTEGEWFRSCVSIVPPCSPDAESCSEPDIVVACRIDCF